MPLRTKILYLVSLATFLRSFAQVIYTPSLITMRGDLETTTTLVGLTLSVYGLVLAFAQIAYGPIVDRFDSKRILLVGMIAFSLACLGGFLARDVVQLLLIRALQAMGIAAAASVGIALITDLFPVDERGRAMGVFEIFNAAGAAAGPVIGAALALLFSWRAGFLALAVIGLAVVLLSLWQLPPQPAHAQKVGLADFALIAFTPATAGALTLGFVQFYALYTMHTLIPVLLSQEFGLYEGGIGLMLALLPLSAITGSLLGGRASDRIGLRQTLLFGSIGTVLAMGSIAFLSGITASPAVLILIGLSILCLGFSIGFCLPVQIKVMVSFFPLIRGTAGSTLYFARFLGSTVAPLVTGLLADRLGLSAGFGSAVILLVSGTLVTFVAIHDPLTEPVPGLRSTSPPD